MRLEVRIHISHRGKKQIDHFLGLTNAPGFQNFEPTFIIGTLVHKPSNLVFMKYEVHVATVKAYL